MRFPFTDALFREKAVAVAATEASDGGSSGSSSDGNDGGSSGSGGGGDDTTAGASGAATATGRAARVSGPSCCYSLVIRVSFALRSTVSVTVNGYG